MSFPWSLIQSTPLATIARELITYNKCEYHNWNHVVSMYQYFADTNEPYDEALDWAILFHDIVYDEKPEKELRSRITFTDMMGKYSGCTPDIFERSRVCKLIMCTVDHVVLTEVKGSSAIVRADLHGLTKRLTAFENFGKIMKESMSLYNIDEVEFAKNSEKFMSTLFDRVGGNMINDPEYAEFYDRVKDGIILTINLALTVSGNYKWI